MGECKKTIGGYAPGNYSCHCNDCGQEFIGDKRAWQCKDCAEKQSIETCQDMLDVLNTNGSAYLYKHNGGDKKLINIISVLQEVKDLRAKLNAAEKDRDEYKRIANVALEDVLRFTKERDQYKDKLESHAPDGHNFTNEQAVTFRRERDSSQQQVEVLRGALKEIYDELSGVIGACGKISWCSDKDWLIYLQTTAQKAISTTTNYERVKRLEEVAEAARRTLGFNLVQGSKFYANLVNALDRLDGEGKSEVQE